MKRTLSLLATALLLVSVPALGADKSTKIIRGGLGFLYPDHNSFTNPGQFPLSYGMAFEAGYTRVNASTTQALTPSLVYGNGKVGLGAFYQRAGAGLTGAGSTNAVGAGFGVALLKNKLTFGAGYSTSLSTGRTDDGTVQLTANLNGPQRQGPSLGLGVTSTINSTIGQRQTATLGVGYSFRSNNSLEGGVKFNRLSTLGDYSPFLAGTLGTQFLYVGANYLYGVLAKTHTVSARVGFIFGRYVDVSALATRVMTTGGATSYGASLRASF